MAKEVDRKELLLDDTKVRKRSSALRISPVLMCINLAHIYAV